MYCKHCGKLNSECKCGEPRPIETVTITVPKDLLYRITCGLIDFIGDNKLTIDQRMQYCLFIAEIEKAKNE